MITNHQSNPSPPGLSAIEQIIVDLLSKRDSEVAHGSELEKQLNESRKRQDWLANTIKGLVSEYGLSSEYVSNLQNAFVRPVPVSWPQVQQVSIPSTQVASQEPQTHQATTSTWVKPDTISWLELIRNAIRQLDNFVNQSDIGDYLGMDEKAKKAYTQSLSGSLTSYRSTGHIVGVPVYQKTLKGTTISLFYNGLPEFFEDVEARKLKPDYEEKIKEKAKQNGYYLTEEEALSV